MRHEAAMALTKTQVRTQAFGRLADSIARFCPVYDDND
jgi:hypothetical protein